MSDSKRPDWVDRVKVFEMAKETGINIFMLYAVLKINPDPMAQEIGLKLKNAKNREDANAALNEYIAYSREKGDREFAGTESEWQFLPGQNITDNRRWMSIDISKERVQSGVAWGTRENMDRIYKEIVEMNTLEEALELYRSIPQGAPEQAVVIRLIAGYFVE